MLSICLLLMKQMLGLELNLKYLLWLLAFVANLNVVHISFPQVCPRVYVLIEDNQEKEMEHKGHN